jgi:hypothetical protein
MPPPETEQANEPVAVEVLAPTLEGPGLCSGCELILGEAGVGGARIQQPSDYPADWRADHERLVALLTDIHRCYGAGVRIVWLDPASPAGLWTGLRHGVRRYPTFIVGGRRKVVGCESAALRGEIDAILSRRA